MIIMKGARRAANYLANPRTVIGAVIGVAGTLAAKSKAFSYLGMEIAKYVSWEQVEVSLLLGVFVGTGVYGIFAANDEYGYSLEYNPKDDEFAGKAALRVGTLTTAVSFGIMVAKGVKP